MAQNKAPKFPKVKGFQRITSSPKYAQPNGTVWRNRKFLNTYSPKQVDTKGRMPMESKGTGENLTFH